MFRSNRGWQTFFTLKWQNTLNIFFNLLWRYVMILVILQLYASSSCRFIYGLSHAFCYAVSIHDNLSIYISGCPAGRLGKTSPASQETFLVGIKNGYKRNFG